MRTYPKCKLASEARYSFANLPLTLFVSLEHEDNDRPCIFLRFLSSTEIAYHPKLKSCLFGIRNLNYGKFAKLVQSQKLQFWAKPVFLSLLDNGELIKLYDIRVDFEQNWFFFHSSCKMRSRFCGPRSRRPRVSHSASVRKSGRDSFSGFEFWRKKGGRTSFL